MTARKTARNARIVRLRGMVALVGDDLREKPALTWEQIAGLVSKEFPKDKCTWQRCQAIYKRDTTGVLLNDGAKFYRDRK